MIAARAAACACPNPAAGHIAAASAAVAGRTAAAFAAAAGRTAAASPVAVAGRIAAASVALAMAHLSASSSGLRRRRRQASGLPHLRLASDLLLDAVGPVAAAASAASAAPAAAASAERIPPSESTLLRNSISRSQWLNKNLVRLLINSYYLQKI